MREWKGKEGREEGRGKREEKMRGDSFLGRKASPRTPIGANLEQKAVKIRRQWHPRCISFFVVTPAKAGVQALINKTDRGRNRRLPGRSPLRTVRADLPHTALQSVVHRRAD